LRKTKGYDNAPENELVPENGLVCLQYSLIFFLIGQVCYSTDHKNKIIKNRPCLGEDPEINMFSKLHYCVSIKENDTDNMVLWLYCFQICHYCYINYSTGHEFKKRSNFNLLLISTA